MTNCQEWFEELTHTADIILDEDLRALRRQSDRVRIERYNELKSNEDELLHEFDRECSAFLTSSERAHVRGNLRLAQLLIAASFYSEDGDLPRAMEGEFRESELQAVVDFDRYRQFDALSEEQIQRKIRRMEGEVYELVREYTSTQLNNLDDLLEAPDAQQDVMERLLDRYEERREKVRQGFFIYVETHGLEHMVERIEVAVEAVNESSARREEIAAELRSPGGADGDDGSGTGSDGTAAEPTVDVKAAVRDRRQLEAKLDQLVGQVEGGSVNHETLQAELREVQKRAAELTEVHDSAARQVDERIEQTSELEEDIVDRIETLQDIVADTASDDGTDAEEKAAELVENELEKLHEQREEMRREMRRLEREREGIEAAREALEQRRETLDARVETEATARAEESAGAAGTAGADDQHAEQRPEAAGIDGSSAVTAEMARIFEMDYLGRFDISMHETPVVYTRDGEVDVPDGYWEGRSQRWDHTGELLGLLGDESPDRYPTAPASRYEVTNSELLGLGEQTEMVVEAAVQSNLHAYAQNGVDTQPAGMDAFLAAVNDVVDEAETGGYEYLLALASPTGWTDEVVQTVSGEEMSRARVSKHVGICLVDLQDGTLVYDDSDPLVRENAHLFELPIDEERVEDCVAELRQEYVDDLVTESVLLRDVVADHGYDTTVVKRAFNRLEAQGHGEQLYVDDLGLSLDVST